MKRGVFFGGGAECGTLSEKPRLTDDEQLIPECGTLSEKPRLTDKES